jgi:hypothetical protein
MADGERHPSRAAEPESPKPPAEPPPGTLGTPAPTDDSKPSEPKNDASRSPVPSIYSSDRLTPRAAGTHDEAHQRAERLPPCPGLAAAQYEAQVSL